MEYNLRSRKCCLSVQLSVCLSVCLCVHPSVCLSVCLSQTKVVLPSTSCCWRTSSSEDQEKRSFKSMCAASAATVPRNIVAHRGPFHLVFVFLITSQWQFNAFVLSFILCLAVYGMSSESKLLFFESQSLYICSSGDDACNHLESRSQLTSMSCIRFSWSVSLSQRLLLVLSSPYPLLACDDACNHLELRSQPLTSMSCVRFSWSVSQSQHLLPGLWSLCLLLTGYCFHPVIDLASCFSIQLFLVLLRTFTVLAS